ncbi:CDP-alcohol phosphatidyltransferase family protein [Candidatus Woesearchaeota archaeon]|nr:CDP-alcohol phosphatidyltransferase family protein [Candidatus Woesearchaeota archaeon]
MGKLPRLEDVRKAVLKPAECIWMYNYRRLTTRITRYIVVTDIKANHITFLSFLFALSSAYLFSLGHYKYFIIGAIFMQVGYLFDLIDGEIARFKKQASKFGQWFDNSTDVFGQIAIIIGITLGVFRIIGKDMVLLLGLFAIVNQFLNMYIRMLNDKVFYSPDNKRPEDFAIGKRFYFGYEGTMYFIITVMAFLNLMYYALLFFSTIWGLIWIKKVFNVLISKRNT